jgi:hypothetical protein
MTKKMKSKKPSSGAGSDSDDALAPAGTVEREFSRAATKIPRPRGGA